MRLHQLERELTACGYALQRITGSHRHYRHGVTHCRLTVALHPGGGGKEHGLSWRKVVAVRKELRRQQAQNVR